ncbi:type VI secretion system lipoprotein TssJ [Bowmanella denitrificans]|uniref:type VI secretion system lipoprotein TssJ n=1 Tax=Bowmanella denitrificans TaxID=366582 RepID=UPI000C9A46C6|nr:type VI secretion system lipoprotein TssJ [Bowmanella denitrificans]
MSGVGDKCFAVLIRTVVPVLLFLLAGCGSSTMVKDVFSVVTKADITFVAAPDVNPDINGRPSPVLVRYYELRSPSAFNSADFFSLYDKAAGELGNDYIRHDDLELKPGQQVQKTVIFSEETRYLGLIAAYRDIGTATWKRVVELPPDSNSSIQIALGSNMLQLNIE